MAGMQRNYWKPGGTSEITVTTSQDETVICIDADPSDMHSSAVSFSFTDAELVEWAEGEILPRYRAARARLKAK